MNQLFLTQGTDQGRRSKRNTWVTQGALNVNSKEDLMLPFTQWNHVGAVHIAFALSEYAARGLLMLL